MADRSQEPTCFVSSDSPNASDAVSFYGSECDFVGDKACALGYYLLGGYKLTEATPSIFTQMLEANFNWEKRKSTSSKDPVRNGNHRSSSVSPSPVSSQSNFHDQAISSKPRAPRPRTVKQQKNRKKQKELEKEFVRNERWKCPSDTDNPRVTILPLSFDERPVDCDGLDQNAIAKKSRFPSISRIFDRRFRRRTIDCSEIYKYALSEADLSRLSTSNLAAPRIVSFKRDDDLNKAKSQLDLSMISSSKNIDQVTLFGRAEPRFVSRNQKFLTPRSEFRKKFVQGLWSAHLPKSEIPTDAPSETEKIPNVVIKSINKSIDSGYESPSTAPKKAVQESQESKRPYEHFDTRRASLFNEFFGKKKEKVELARPMTDNENDRVYSQIDAADNSINQQTANDSENPSNVEAKNSTESESKSTPSNVDQIVETKLEIPITNEPKADPIGDNSRLQDPATNDPLAKAQITTVAINQSKMLPIVVAIDFGTAYSGYAYAFRDKNGEQVYIMRRLNTNDPGASSAKCPTCILLEPDGRFHSFGWEARDYYHDLEPESATRYLYFECFKMLLDREKELNRNSKIAAVNGIPWPAIDVISHCLRYLKRHALIEISECVGFMVDPSHVQWVVTVPAIWRESVKQLMRLSAYQAGIANPEKSGQLIVALEPEAAAMYCTTLKQNEILPPLTPPRTFFSLPSSLRKSAINRGKIFRTDFQATQVEPGNAYVVVDCGGGTVDITVHQLAQDGAGIVEIHKASGGPHGSTEIDCAFESLLCDIFSADFMNQFRSRYPAAYTDLMLSFETRKRAAHPYKNNPFNVALPFAFLEFYRKKFGHRVECAVKRNERKQHVTWNPQGMLRLSAEIMNFLFMPTLVSIVKLIDNVLQAVKPVTLSYLFLVGGFAESPMLQHEIRNSFENLMKIIIPNQASASVLQGAVLFGLRPQQISIRRSRLTYGISVFHPFNPSCHPREKRVSKNGRDWCKDVFEKFVAVNESIKFDQELIRHYCPASTDQNEIIIQIYSTESADPKFVTDVGVKRCAVLKLDLSANQNRSDKENVKDREIKTSIKFGDTELALKATDISTEASVKGSIDFLI